MHQKSIDLTLMGENSEADWPALLIQLSNIMHRLKKIIISTFILTLLWDYLVIDQIENL